MIGGVSHALAGLSVASAGFERAATRLAGATTVDPATMAAGASGVSDAAVGMLAARFAFMASLQVARTSNEMVAQAVELVG